MVRLLLGLALTKPVVPNILFLFYRSCAFNERIPWNLLIEMCVALFTLITTGAPILVGGWQVCVV